MTVHPHFEAEAEVLSLAARGWRLFPCVQNNKTPLLKSWPTLASSDPATIRKWAAKYPGCNWAVVCGPESGLWVLDVDGEKGLLSLSQLEREHGPLPATLTSQTGREDGGEHRFFTWPVDRNIRSSTRRLGNGLDVRAVGGYVVIPPSIHSTGRKYQWVDPDITIADAPVWLLGAVTTPDEVVPTPVAEVGILPTGNRNDGLTRLGGGLRRKGSTQAQIEIELLIANARRCRPPLSEEEVFKIAASVARYEPGGPDPLESAWQAIQEKAYRSRYERFLALARHLQLARPRMAIALPVQRIGALMGVHWTMVSQYRQKAVRDGLLEPAGEYIARRRAGLYRVTETLTKYLTNGLVRVRAISPSESPLVRMKGVSPSESENFRRESDRKAVEISSNVGTGNGESGLRCYVHGTQTTWWQRVDGDAVCWRCHPGPAEARIQ
jgi:hypothetical protein